jgi:hypothetical protein
MNSGDSLERLRLRAGIGSMTKFARKLGYSNCSGLQRYTKGGERAHKPLPQSLVKRLLDNVTGTGYPPVTRAEILEISGIVTLTDTTHPDSVHGQNTVAIAGDYIPVLSIMDVITMDDPEDRRDISPPGYIFYNRPLAENERAIRLPDDSLAPTYPADAVAIVELGGTPQAGKPALVRITEADGSKSGAVRLYSHRGHADDGSKIEAFEATNETFPNYRTLPQGVFPQVEAVGRVSRVIITIEC